MTVRTRPIADPNFTDDEVHAKGWKNLYVLERYSFVSTQGPWPSKAIAKLKSDTCDFVKDHAPIGQATFVLSDGQRIDAGKLLFVVQIPSNKA